MHYIEFCFADNVAFVGFGRVISNDTAATVAEQDKPLIRLKSDTTIGIDLHTTENGGLSIFPNGGVRL